jgi:hypothetical protein
LSKIVHGFFETLAARLSVHMGVVDAGLVLVVLAVVALSLRAMRSKLTKK